jgi:major membrane immunogen (membrane-anchored lipoprotein)
MKNNLLILIIFLLSLLSGCSNGDYEIPDRNETVTEDSDTNLEDSETDKDDEKKETLNIPLCDETLTIQSGDKVVKISENPQIKVQHLSDNSRYICLKSGEAVIERISN